MTRQGDYRGLLQQLHAPNCNGQEFSTCRAVVTDVDPGQEIVVVFMEWCGDCGAASWETV